MPGPALALSRDHAFSLPEGRACQSQPPGGHVSVELIREVMDWMERAPKDLSQSERLVLMVIAEQSREHSRNYNGRVIEARTCFPGRESMMKWIGLEETSLRSAYQRLAHRGLEVRVEQGRDAAGRPVYAARGHATVLKLPLLRSLNPESTDDSPQAKATAERCHPHCQAADCRPHGSAEATTEDLKGDNPPSPTHRTHDDHPSNRSAATSALFALLRREGFKESELEGVLRVAVEDVETFDPIARLAKAPAYRKRCLSTLRAEVQRDAASLRDLEPRCEDHEWEPAGSCTACHSEVKAGDRIQRYFGKRLP